MKFIARLAALLLFFTILTTPTVAQKRQTPAKPLPKPAAPPTPAPTFDNLVPADAYVIYVEVRDVGQLIHSSTFNDLVDPILKLAGLPREFKSTVKWINAHADDVMSSRLLVAYGNINKNVPATLMAIEFASPEEATKFATPLNEFLPTVVPTPMPEPSPKSAPAPPKQNFHIERLGSLVILTARPWTMKQLRPTGSKSLADDTNFRTARNRFNSEPLFAYVDFKLMNKDEEEQRKHYEEERLKVEEQAKKTQAEEKRNREETPTTEAGPKPVIIGTTRQLAVTSSSEAIEEPPPPDPMSMALANLGQSFFGGETQLPEALALALSYEGESFDLRSLLLNAPGEKSSALPFWPNVIMGAEIAPEAPNIFPADTEIFATMSLDLPQIYREMSKPRTTEMTVSRVPVTPSTKIETESPLKPLEKKLDISVENDLLPLLGGEVAIGLPMHGLNLLGISGPPVRATEKKDTGEEADQSNTHAPIIAISVKDKERLHALLPKLIDKLGFKGASQFAATEQREDTEIVSYANFFAYAFVGNFLVLSTDVATTRHVVDSYLKQETLGSDNQFRAYTRWQPRQLQGQLYISPALMNDFQSWVTQANSRMADQTRNQLASLSTVAQPIAYSLSNEGFGPLHELHVPKNLVTMLVVGISGDINPPPLVQNERMAISMMYQILYAEEQYKASKGGGYGTLEDLIAAKLFEKDLFEKSGYKFEVIVNGDKFEVSAVPVEYGKTGSLSLFLDHDHVLRGGDRNGAAATASDPRFPN